MLEYGMYVKNKITGEIGTVQFSTWGYSIHYRDANGKLNKTLGCPEHKVLKYWEVINQPQEQTT